MNIKSDVLTPSTRLTTYFCSLAAIWTIIVAGLWLLDFFQLKETQIRMAKTEALANFNKDQAFRFWAAKHGGIYVPVNERTQPNPFLSHIPDRDILTKTGKLLTLMNPAYMLRQMMEEYEDLYGIRGHITSLQHYRPETAPDEWEKAALTAFKGGQKEAYEITEISGQPHLRLMRPMFVKEGCLKCHFKQGYRVGDVRGGVSLSIPLNTFFAKRKKVVTTHSISFVILWIIGIAGIGVATNRLRKRIKQRDEAEIKLQKAHDNLELRVEERTNELKQEIEERKRMAEERELLISDLKEALSKVKTMSGMLPICSNCKKIRDDKGYWNRVEKYIGEHSTAEFTHSICPDCVKKLYPDLDIYDDNNETL